MEIVSKVFGMFVIDHMGNRTILMINFTLCGLVFITAALLPKGNIISRYLQSRYPFHSIELIAVYISFVNCRVVLAGLNTDHGGQIRVVVRICRDLCVRDGAVPYFS